MEIRELRGSSGALRSSIAIASLLIMAALPILGAPPESPAAKKGTETAESAPPPGQPLASDRNRGSQGLPGLFSASPEDPSGVIARRSALSQGDPQAAKPPASAQAAATASAAFAAPSAPILLRKQVVVDQQGFGDEVMSMLVPKDWRFKGGVSWDLAKSPPVALMAFSVSNPDGLSVLEKPADMNFMWCQDPNVNYTYGQMGQAVMQPMGAAEFLQNFYIPRVRSAVSDIRVLETQPLPGLAQFVLARAEALLGIFHQISPPVAPSQSRTESARVKIEYTFNGRRMTEDFTASVTFSTTTMNSMYGAVPLVFWMPQVMSFRAPSEEMPAKVRLFQILMYSGAENPRWTVNCIRLQAIVTRENLRHQQAIFARLRQIRETQSEISDMIWDTMRKRSQAQDRAFDNYSQALRGVDTYVNPNGGYSVELPTGFHNVWTNGTDYILSDSPTYNPNVAGAGGNWTQMDRRR